MLWLSLPLAISDPIAVEHQAITPTLKTDDDGGVDSADFKALVSHGWCLTDALPNELVAEHKVPLLFPPEEEMWYGWVTSG